MPDLISQLSFLIERLNWVSIFDIFLVTLVFFIILVVVRDTQAVVLLRGVFVLLVLFALLTSLISLPALSWLVQTSLPSLLLAIPVIFAPEIRRGLEKLGRAGSNTLPLRRYSANQAMQQTIKTIVSAAQMLSNRRHGALIILQRGDNLQEYIQTGIRLNARLSPELLLQIFYPNTPLHDGAVIITEHRITAAACVMPLSASGIFNRSPESKMGLRHRAGLGISEACDAVAVVVSEETGSISITHNGRLLRRLDVDRLENLLLAFYRPSEIPNSLSSFFRQAFRRSTSIFREE